MSAQSIKHSRPIIGIVLILFALTTINFLAYSIMNEPKVHMLQTNELPNHNEINTPVSKKTYSEESIHGSVAGPSGMAFNVQDEGIGAAEAATEYTESSRKMSKKSQQQKKASN